MNDSSLKHDPTSGLHRVEADEDQTAELADILRCHGPSLQAILNTLNANWAANKSFEISKFKFKISESSNLRTSQGSFSAVQVPARVPKRAPLVELVLTMTSMRRERTE